MAVDIKRLTLAKLAFCGCVLFSIFVSLSSAMGASNPFETNPSLRAYGKEAAQAVQSKGPEYLKVLQTDEKEMEDIYQYLRDQIDKPLDIWTLVLLDYPRLRLLRNEIYARHGRVFTSEDLDSYFRSSSWYKPNTDYTDSSLSEIEQNNLSVLKRIEYLKFHRNEEFIKKVEISKNGLKEFTGENKWIKVTKKEIIFKESGVKIPSIFAKERNTKAHVYLEPNIPLVAISYWDVTVSPGVDDYTVHEGVDIYNIRGRKLNSFPEGSAPSYSPEIKAFILSTGGGGCFDGGPGTVSEFIFNAEGKVLFSADYRDCGAGIEYLIPLWGKNLLGLIAEEEGKKENTSGRIVVFGENGEQMVSVKINTDKDSLPMPGSDQQKLTQFVLIAPDLIYAYSKDSAEQKLVFLKKSLVFNPQVRKMHAYRPVVATTNGNDCNIQKTVDLIAPVYNPAVLWEKRAFRSNVKPIITQKYVIIITPQQKESNSQEKSLINSNGSTNLYVASDIVAIDKLAGRQIWAYHVPGGVQAMKFRDNLLAVKYYGGLSLVQIDTGKPLWNVKISIQENEKKHFYLCFGKEGLLVEEYNWEQLYNIIDFYEIGTGGFIKSVELQKLSPEFANYYSDAEWITSMDKIFIQFHNRKNDREYKLLAIDFNANEKWIYTLSAKEREQEHIPNDNYIIFSMSNCNITIRDFHYFQQRGKYAVNLDQETGKPANIDPDLPLIWSEHELSELDRHHKSQLYKKNKPKALTTSEADEPASRKAEKAPESAPMGPKAALAVAAETYLNRGLCLPSPLSDEAIYTEGSYQKGYLSDRYLKLSDACLTATENELFRKRYWAFSPWVDYDSEEKRESIRIDMIFIDNNFMLIKSTYKILNDQQEKIRYWAIGEQALKDYVLRKDGQIYINIQKEMQAEQQKASSTKNRKYK